MASDEFEYDVALSFAGEDRVTAREFADLLTSKNIRVFYDEDYADDLWGKDLIAHLADLYQNKARFCVMFISRHYPLKRWTNFERQHIQARAFRDTNEYILPIRVDDTNVPGIAETMGYRDMRQHSLESIASTLEKKLAKSKGQHSKARNPKISSPGKRLATSSPFDSIPMPTIERTFTQLEKDRFAKAAFETVRKYFQQALKQLKEHDREIETDFTKINNLEFTSRIYVKGTPKCECKIWLGDRNTIYYSGELRDFSQGHSYNESLTVEANKEELRLRISGFGLGMGVPVEERLVTKERGAEYLWKVLISRFQYR
jgi:hypothetical protein